MLIFGNVTEIRDSLKFCLMGKLQILHSFLCSTLLFVQAVKENFNHNKNRYTPANQIGIVFSISKLADAEFKMLEEDLIGIASTFD